jgi:hypothetical protein
MSDEAGAEGPLPQAMSSFDADSRGADPPPMCVSRRQGVESRSGVRGVTACRLPNPGFRGCESRIPADVTGVGPVEDRGEGFWLLGRGLRVHSRCRRGGMCDERIAMHAQDFASRRRRCRRGGSCDRGRSFGGWRRCGEAAAGRRDGVAEACSGSGRRWQDGLIHGHRGQSRSDGGEGRDAQGIAVGLPPSGVGRGWPLHHGGWKGCVRARLAAERAQALGPDRRDCDGARNGNHRGLGDGKDN